MAFEFGGLQKSDPKKTYFALRHEVIRAKQADHADEVHHPDEKLDQIKLIPLDRKYRTLELFAGEKGNLTPIYRSMGEVDAFDKKLGTGDSYEVFHRLIAERQKYSIIDIDPYGGPESFFPHIFKLIDDGYLLVTMPMPGINIINRMNEVHNFVWWRAVKFTPEDAVVQIANWGLCFWRKVTMMHYIPMGKMWRFLFRVEKVKATEYVGIDLKMPRRQKE